MFELVGSAFELDLLLVLQGGKAECRRRRASTAEKQATNMRIVKQIHCAACRGELAGHQRCPLGPGPYAGS